MAQIGKCSNRVSCTLAYTGQEIRFEGAPVCPECGQPLTVTKGRKKGGKLWILILIPLLFLIMAGIGFYIAERYVIGSDTTKATPSPSATPADSGQKMVEGKSQVPSDVLNKAKQSPSPQPKSSVTTPTVTPSPETTVQKPPGPQESPAPNEGGTPPNELARGKTTPPPNTQASPPEPQHSPANPEKTPHTSETPESQETVETKPKELSSAEVTATKQDVLKRISALPKMSEAEKTKLSDKVETARYMQRVGVVYFDKGSSTLSKSSIDKLVALFKASELVEKMSDPTLVFIVAGYADTGGDPKVNLRLSDERAQAVFNTLEQNAGVINLIRTVGMGGTDLLSQRPDQNRAAEIWAVIP